jgi:hypothetical protein
VDHTKAYEGMIEGMPGRSESRGSGGLDLKDGGHHAETELFQILVYRSKDCL